MMGHLLCLLRTDKSSERIVYSLKLKAKSKEHIFNQKLAEQFTNCGDKIEKLFEANSKTSISNEAYYVRFIKSLRVPNFILLGLLVPVVARKNDLTFQVSCP